MWLNLIGTVPDNKEFTKWSSEDISSWIMHNAHYLYIPHRTSRNHLYTFWIVTDLNTFLGRKLLGEVLEYIVSSLHQFQISKLLMNDFNLGIKH